ncbi:hypothetical protein [Hyalangium versicolor]|uniref:hypothetical protein n=1 Tax=Hyalangium versicolor TaxID=2861190 RepID=UPI001CCF2782|nr:hypothetical protein [Hyalangium versicolor]
MLTTRSVSTGTPRRAEQPKPAPAPAPAKAKPSSPAAASTNPAVAAYRGESSYAPAQRTTASTVAGAPGPTPSPSPGPRPTPVPGSIQELKDAKEKVKKKDEELAGKLAHLGPALTDAQKQKFIKAWHDENKETYQAEAKAASALKKQLQDPEVPADQARKGYAALADSPEAKAALDWASKEWAKPGSPQYHNQEVADLAAKAGANAAPEIISEAETPRKGVEQLEKALKPFIDGKDVVKGAGDVQRGIEIAKAAADGKYDQLKFLAKDWNEKSPLFKAFAVGGVVAGASKAAKEGADKEYAAAIKDLAGAGKDGLNVLAGATHSLSESGKLADLLGKNAPKAEKLAELGARFAPALGAVSSAASLADHVGEEDKNAGTFVAIAGDALSIAGNVLELTPAAPVGAVINGVGSFLSAAGDFASTLITRHADQREDKKLLEQAGVPKEIVDPLSKASSNTRQLEKYGLKPEQVQQLVSHHSDLINLGGYGESIVKAGKAVGVPADKLDTFISKLDEAYKSSQAQYGDIFRNIIENAETTGGDYTQTLREQIKSRAPEAYKLGKA